MMSKPRLVVGISGASGIIYGIRLLELAKANQLETHLVITKSAERTRAYETLLSSKELHGLADVTYSNADIAAPIASGSFKTLGMIIAPCSVRTLAEIATGVTSSLISRAADVTLKERRRLALMVRESPLHAGHLKNMLAVTEYGGIIAPPVPALYTQPQTLDDIIDQTIGRLLDLFDISITTLKRWGEAT